MEDLLWRLGRNSLRAQEFCDVWRKDDLSEVTSVDIANHVELVNFISTYFPNDVIISEEGNENFIYSFSDGRGIWYVDSLDGTREYSMGLSEWCIQVCRWDMNGPDQAWIWEARDGGTLWSWSRSVGSVYYEKSDHLLYALPKLVDSEECIHVVSRGHPDSWTEAKLSKFPGQKVMSGSAGVKVCKILMGEATHYWNGSGKMKRWDWAAPYAIAKGAGVYIYHEKAEDQFTMWNPTFMDVSHDMVVDERILFTSHTSI